MLPFCCRAVALAPVRSPGVFGGRLLPCWTPSPVLVAQEGEKLECSTDEHDYGEHPSGRNEGEEEPIVALPYAVPNPRAMVVEALNAILAH